MHWHGADIQPGLCIVSASRPPTKVGGYSYYASSRLVKKSKNYLDFEVLSTALSMHQFPAIFH